MRHVRDLPTHFGIELAVVAHFDFGERTDSLATQIAELSQQRPASRRV